MTAQTKSTKKRILRAGAVIFGHKGFKDATIRRIAKAADVNIAAINYHFQGKEGLYGAVLEDVFHTGFTRFPATLETGTEAAPEERLRVFIRAMFYRLQSREGWGGMAGQGRLIAREMVEPSPAFLSLLKRYIEPHKDLLAAIIVDIMQTDPGPEKLMSCAISILGQCIYYAIGATVIRTVFTDSAATMDNLDRLADSVWLFSLGGIARVKEEFLLSREADL